VDANPSVAELLVQLADRAEMNGNRWLHNERSWRVVHYSLLIPSTILASVAAATAVGDVWNGALAGGLALAAAALSAAAAALRPAMMASGSTQKARQYFEVEREARQAVRDATAPDGNELRHEHDRLRKRFDEIRTSPEPALPDASA
jgi:hypothetical protein